MGKHGIIYGVGSIAQSAAGFLLLPLYANHLAPSDYGVFSLIQMIGVVLGAFFYLGASSALPRSYFDYEDPEDRKKVFNTTLLLLVSGAFLQIGIGLIFSNFISELIIGSSEYSHLLFIGLLTSAITFINTGFFVYLKLLRESKIVVIMSITNLFITVFIVYYLIVVSQMGIAAPIYAILFSQCITAVFFIIYLWKSISILSILPNEISFQLNYGFPVAIASLAQMLTNWGDRVILNNFLTTYDVGIYSLSVNVANIYMVLIAFSFTMIWNPIMMEYKNDKNIKKLFMTITFYYTLISILFIMFFNLFFLDMFNFLLPNNPYQEGIRLVPIIMMGLFVYSLINIFNAGILYAKKTNILIYMYVAWGIINILMNLIMIQYFQIIGAVITAIITRLGISLTALLISRKYFTYPFEYNRYIKVGLIILIFLSLQVIINNYYSPIYLVYYKICLFLFITILIYVIVFNHKEKSIIKNLFKTT